MTVDVVEMLQSWAYTDFSANCSGLATSSEGGGSGG